jgi:hypothetical protein
MRALITGAAGSGTTTLAAALAERWGAVAIEADAFFWLPTDPPFKSKREPEHRRALFEQQLISHENAVVSGSVVGWGLDGLFDLVVFLYVEAAVRIRRLQLREDALFGRVDPAFLQWAAQYDEGPAEGRSLAKHEAWLRTLNCPVIRLVGEKSVAQQVALVAATVPNPSIERTSSSKLRLLPAAAHVKR